MTEYTVFGKEHIPQAAALLRAARDREAASLAADGNPFTRDLPDGPAPTLDGFAENGLGMAATRGNDLVGFLCPLGPWWDGGGTKRVYIPLYGHGAAADCAVESVYENLYARAAENWLRQGVSTHAITFFAHDDAGIGTFFDLGFGKCCTDRIRSCDAPFPVVSLPPGVTFAPVRREEIAVIRPLRRALHRHMAKSPCFLMESDAEYQLWLARVERSDRRTCAAYADGAPVAYMDVDACGDSYLSVSPDTQNIVGAYCLPSYRGTGLAAALLAYVAGTVWDAGYRYLGVDHESTNPAARHFWRKHFAPYTYSLLRRL